MQIHTPCVSFIVLFTPSDRHRALDRPTRPRSPTIPSTTHFTALSTACSKPCSPEGGNNFVEYGRSEVRYVYALPSVSSPSISSWTRPNRDLKVTCRRYASTGTKICKELVTSCTCRGGNRAGVYLKHKLYNAHVVLALFNKNISRFW